MKKMLNNTKTTVKILMERLTNAKKNYEKWNDSDSYFYEMRSIALEFNDYFGIGDIILSDGEKMISQGHYELGIRLILMVKEILHNVANTTLLYMRLAEYYFQSGDTEKGRECLIMLCSCVDNYEESIEFNDLTSVWEKYHHYVDGKVLLPQKVMTENHPTLPGKCSTSIAEILVLPEDELLSALSEHLNEMSVQGECLEYLNQWERTAYHIDTLCMEVNSGGFFHYLYYNGNRFAEVQRACKLVGAEKTLSLLRAIQQKFPQAKIPKNPEQIQNVLDMMDGNIDFETEDNKYYDSAEKELLGKLYQFVCENKDRFR